MNQTPDQLELEAALGALRWDWSFLEPRLRTLGHDLSTECAGLNLRLHYPAFRQAQPTINDFVDAVGHFVAHFCLPRSEIDSVYAKKDHLSSFAFHAEVTRLNDRARDLFQKANVAASRTGEAGELILFILTEWMLGAPQIIAKMSLKTSSAMPVHGADGVHVRIEPETGRLIVYSGEAKLHKEVRKAIASAVESIRHALSFDKMKHELELVQRNVDFAGLPVNARDTSLQYLDPFDERSNERLDVVTCLIGFDYAAYADLARHGDAAEQVFQELAGETLAELGPAIAAALTTAGMGNNLVELFLIPLPCVQDLRDRFQVRIGWKN